MSQLYEYVKMAIANIKANKVRSFLTMLGIIIGISSVILIVALGNGARDVITEEMAGIGEGQLALFSVDESGSYPITMEDMEALKKNVVGVRAVLAQMQEHGEITTQKGEFQVNLEGVSAGYSNYDTTGLLAGRYFTKAEEEEGSMCCILKEEEALRLFGSTDILGMMIEVDTTESVIDLTVVGIQRSKDSDVSFVYEDSTVSMIVPLNLFKSAYGTQVDEFQNVMILAEKGADTHLVANQSMRLLNRRHNCKMEAQMYRVQDFTDVMAIIDNVIRAVTMLVSMIAAISLLVGGVGVMNIMLVSVTERTREIGIRKALGAKTRSILLQFLSESAIITMIGGILGIFLGVGSAHLVADIIGMVNPAMKFTPSVSIKTVLLTTIFSSVIGIFFGIYPARKAAKMSPIEALRRD